MKTSKSVAAAMTTAVVIVGVLAIARSARLASAQDGGGAPAAETDPGSSRLRATLVRVTLPPDSDGGPVRLAELGPKPPAAVRPRRDASTDAAGTGEFAAIPYPHDLLAAFRKRGQTRVLARSEVEVLPTQRKVRIRSVKDFPIQIENINAGNRVLTTQFKSIGFDLGLERAGDAKSGLWTAHLEFSDIVARRASVPIIMKVSTSGGLRLPDGYTAVFTHVERVEGETLALTSPSGEAKKPPEDVVQQYFVLLTRLDFGR